MTTAHDARRSTSVLVAALASAAAAGLVSTVLGWLLAGTHGLLGALVGTGIVVVFFTLGHLALTMFREVDPALLFLLAMVTYAFQVVALLAVFGSFAAWSDGVSATALGLTIIGCTVCWTAALVMASRRQRIPLFDLGEGAR